MEKKEEAEKESWPIDGSEEIYDRIFIRIFFFLGLWVFSAGSFVCGPATF